VSKIGDAGACRRSATATGPRVRLSPLRSVLALLAVIAAVGLIGPMTSADAEVAHVFSTSFAVTGNPVSVAVDQSTGNVYVLNSAGNVLKFNSAGAPVNFSALAPPGNSLTTGCTTSCRQIAVDNSGGLNQGVIFVGSLQTGTNAGVRVFLPNGRPGTRISNGIPQGIIEPQPFCGIAVDPTGVLYSSHSGTNSNSNFIQNEVNTYKPGQIQPDPFPAQVWPVTGVMRNVGNPEPCRVAVDSKSHMYMTPDSASATNQFLERQILRYTVDPFGKTEPSAKVVDNGSTGLAVDQSDNDLYSNHKTSIARFNEAGELRETFGAGKVVESGGLAVNGTNGTIYAANRLASNVQVFTTVVTPNVNSTTAVASQTMASLGANVDPSGAGNVTSCEFEYGTTTAYGTPVTCAEATPYNGEKNVSASLPSLSKETTYHYRVVVKNANGTTFGPDKTFTTHNVAGVATEAPTEVTQASATLNGSFIGNGEPTSYYFEWGPTAGYGHTTSAPPGESAGAPTGATPVSSPITGLSVYLPQSSPYHYRLVAVNASGTTPGPDRTFFAAPPDAPEITGPATEAVTPSTASLSAAIIPGNGPTVYWVEYGLDSSYGESTPSSESIGSDESAHPVIASLAGLTPGTIYHYRFVAANFGGIAQSPDQILDVPNTPLLGTVSTSGIGKTTATLEGQVNPGFVPTAYQFEYGLTRSYGASTTETALGAKDNSLHPVSAALTGLKPGVTYHYRLVAANTYGSTAESDRTFVTQTIPPAKEARPERSTSVGCKAGFVKRSGKCVKRSKPRRHRHHRQHRHKSKKQGRR
jgi:hypothetical protein